MDSYQVRIAWGLCTFVDTGFNGEGTICSVFGLLLCEQCFFVHTKLTFRWSSPCFPLQQRRQAWPNHRHCFSESWGIHKLCMTTCPRTALHSFLNALLLAKIRVLCSGRAGITSMSAVTNFGTSRRLALGPEKKPVIAVISTHHRTGTVLFQNMGERLCETFLMDYERVDEPFKLSNPNATRTLLYQRYWNTTGRIAVGMHGFEESCEQGQDVGMYCDPLDYECWLDACVSIDQKPEVIHLKTEQCGRFIYVK